MSNSWYNNPELGQQQQVQQSHPQMMYSQPQGGLNYQQQQQQQESNQQMRGTNYGMTTANDSGMNNVAIDTPADDYKESQEDLSVPLSLSSTQLTPEEQRTYLRWYNNITKHTHSKLITLTDIFNFMVNFRLPQALQNRLTIIFRSCKNALNIGQFFAVERLIAKAILDSSLPIRKMILEQSGVPKPKSILSQRRAQDKYEEVEVDAGGQENTPGNPVDIDSFTSLLLTGKTSKKRVRRIIANEELRNKKVHFSEKLSFADDVTTYDDDDTSMSMHGQDSTGQLDLSLPMDQLLNLMARRKENGDAVGLVSSLPNEQQETAEEREVLEGMKDSLSHFKQIQTVDSIGQMNPNMYMNGVPDQFMPGSMQMPLQPLKPTATGSGNHLFKQEMARAQQGNPNGPLQPLKPTATGSANYLVKQQFDPTFQSSTGPAPMQNNNMISPNQTVSPENQNATLQPLKPTATGSANYLMKSHYTQPMNVPQTTGTMQMQPQQPQQPPQQPPQQQHLMASNTLQQMSTGTIYQQQIPNNNSLQPMQMNGMQTQPQSQQMTQTTSPPNLQQRTVSPMGTNVSGMMSPNPTATIISPNTTAPNQMSFHSPQGTGQYVSPYGVSNTTNQMQGYISPQHSAPAGPGHLMHHHSALHAHQLQGNVLQGHQLQGSTTSHSGYQMNNLQPIQQQQQLQMHNSQQQQMSQPMHQQQPQSQQTTSPFGLQGSSQMANNFFQSLLSQNQSPSPSNSQHNVPQLRRTGSLVVPQHTQPSMLSGHYHHQQTQPQQMQQQQQLPHPQQYQQQQPQYQQSQPLQYQQQYQPQQQYQQPQPQYQPQQQLQSSQYQMGQQQLQPQYQQQQQPQIRGAFDMHSLQQQVDSIQQNYQRQ
ncbi:hypothetical protein TBLA_0E02440 [Henningerozyma blattae CBS 6284]|uniref:Uncharacterized protein n=1 Tax=Henningerozyma blattae (strain ATCC 34711 / CBS 6284 / DSM 70876 / NBRC 10599 / NRRL Y-10934 / UCD 77-7) TaxID=1071380 RepID=I2H4J6_HENB6|nr:hypothetical protein TBLA_0E02440 [Tetrapisispora blattae CBS 6284]CCH61298.1 hypothetical protein TBLA_0E02440 [Tetrapisispora blattae CBS 6284]